MRILIVDDSVVFRSQIKGALEGVPSIEVVGLANNGKIAIQKLQQSSVDLITLDMEMPEMDGISTIKEIRKLKFPVRIIVFSSHTTVGSQKALEALSLGADDFVAKPAGQGIDMNSAATRIKEELLPKIFQFLKPGVRPPRDEEKSKSLKTLSDLTSTAGASRESYVRKSLAVFNPSVIVIGSSTGGPPALEKILVNLKAPMRCPVLITQHMPPVFTASLAKRLEDLTGVVTLEGKEAEILQSNRIYVAPGNFHMSLVKVGEQVKIKLDQNPTRNSVRPAVDPLFESAAQIYGPKTMGVILTGMGEDGMLGCRAIKGAGGGVMIQDQASCVVFGMPGAVFADGAFDEVGNLENINQLMRKMTS